MTLSAIDFELLLQANRTLSSKLNVDDVLQSVMEFATKVVKAEASSLLLLDEKKNELYFDVALGSVKDQVKQIRIKVGEGIAGWVAKERQPLIVNDVSKDKRFTGKVDKSTQFQTKNILAVPLLAKGRLVGVIEGINKQNGQIFTESDKEAFELFASQAAIAIENAELFSAVRREKEKLDTVFSQMSDGVMFIDELERIVILNEACSRFLGLPMGDIVGEKFSPSLFPGFKSAQPFNSLSELGSEAVLDFSRAEGKQLFLTLAVRQLSPSKGAKKNGWIIIFRDTTEEKRGERLKRDFLSLMSHKLKTPLTVILGYAPTLLAMSDGLPDFHKKAIKSIHDQGEQLSGLVEKLLRFTMVESDSLQKKIQRLPLEKIIKGSIEALRLDSDDKTILIESEDIAKGGFEVEVDENLCIEALKNILENGIKFNDKPLKKITISALKEDDQIQISLTDNGVGIPSEEVEKVFQKFYQIEDSFTGQVPGAGLGLALSKKVIEELGGKIHLESVLKNGTTVYVSIPAAK